MSQPPTSLPPRVRGNIVGSLDVTIDSASWLAEPPESLPGGHLCVKLTWWGDETGGTYSNFTFELLCTTLT